MENGDLENFQKRKYKFEIQILILGKRSPLEYRNNSTNHMGVRETINTKKSHKNSQLPSKIPKIQGKVEFSWWSTFTLTHFFFLQFCSEVQSMPEQLTNKCILCYKKKSKRYKNSKSHKVWSCMLEQLTSQCISCFQKKEEKNLIENIVKCGICRSGSPTHFFPLLLLLPPINCRRLPRKLPLDKLFHISRRK